MPVLKNQRHELFAQSIAKGKTQAEAYEIAGYKPSEPNASRLTSNEKVQARVQELLGKAAERTLVTIDSITKQLNDDRSAARGFKQAGAMVSASLGIAKIHGLIKDKHEHTGADGGPIQTENTVTEQARRVAFLLEKGARDQSGPATQH
jgi:phage terminase small subunit